MSENYQNNLPQGYRKNPSRSRRRKPGSIRGALEDLNGVANVQLEQAVRELNCFEGLEHVHHPVHNHRTFAINYLEALLQRWSRGVEESQKNVKAGESAVPSNHLPSGPPSFASVVASGTSAPRTTLSFAEVAAPKRNVWQRPPPFLKNKNATNATAANVAISKSPAAALIPFGSYRLGVHSTTSDLDLLALAPPYINRSDFFSSLVQLLQKDERTQQVHPIPTAYTPVIKFVLECGGEHKQLLQIDLVFARVADATKLLQYQRQKASRQGNAWNNTQSPVDYHLDDSDLQDLDEASVRSLNGARVSQMLLESVQYDVGKFQTVLCAVKHWALVRGIYSNVLGFLGGVNWAILVAWICKRYPDASAASTLQIFFRTFAQWRWNTPVLLDDTIADTPPITNVSLQTRALKLPAWDPRTNPRDRLHIMPIITPAYPSMNSSYNVDYPQLRCIQNEMIRTSNMLERQSKQSKDHVYRTLFAPSDFFERHKHFLQINIRASSNQDFVEWFRLVESKIRVLICTLETTEVHAWPFARFFSKPKTHISNGANVHDDFEKSFFIGLRFAPEIDKVDVRHLTMDFLYKVNTWEGRKSTMDLSIAHITDEDVPLYVWEAMRDHSSRVLKESAAEGSVVSENTAPATDDEEEDDDESGCRSVPPNESPSNLASPPKKFRVGMSSVAA